MDEKITFDDFAKLQLKIGTIKSAKRIEGSTKLLRLMIDLGSKTRQLVAGIGEIVTDPNEIVGKQIPVLANLEPKTIRGVESQGMILAADNDGLPVLLHPAKLTPNGSPVR